MKNNLKNIISFIIAVPVFMLLLGFSSKALQRNDAYFRFEPFYEHANDYDVLFFGNSHTINGIFTMELWKDYGIASYNMGGHGNRMASTYWHIKSALEYSNPELIVVDCSYISHNWRIKDFDMGVQHESWDLIPFGKTKVEAAVDVSELDDEPMNMITELLWKFSIYHNRWSEVSLSDAFRIVFADPVKASDLDPVYEPEDAMPGQVNAEMGSKMRINVAKPASDAIEWSDKRLDTRTQGVIYLKKIIEYCKEKDQKLVLSFLPFPAHEDDWCEINTARDIAEEEGVEFIDYFAMDAVNFHTDLFDETSHLNPSGARKTTDIMGRILRDEYGIKDHRGEAEYDRWDKEYEKYQKIKIKHFHDTDDDEAVLMMLYEPHMKVYLDIYDEEEVYEDDEVRALLKNLGIETGETGEFYLYGAKPSDDFDMIWDDEGFRAGISY